MSSEWKEVEIGDVAKLRNGAGIKQEHFAEDGIKLARVSDFTDDSIDFSKCIFVSHHHSERWKSHYLKHGDVVVATVGSWPPNWSSAVGKVVRVPKVDSIIQNQNSCCIIPYESKLDKRYLFYWLKTLKFKWFAGNSAGGSANQARLPVSKLKQYKDYLPPLAEQKAIANILGKLDDKIELNRQMNQTLEEMAQALFQSWFVDFDPVIDNALAAGNEIPEELLQKAEKRQNVTSTLPQELQTLFPNKFIFNETLNKWIPEGWEVKSLGEIATKLGDGLHGTPKYDEDGEYHFINGNNLVDGKIAINANTKSVNYDQFEKYKKELNDRTIFVSINGTIGNIGDYNNEKVILGKSVCYFNVKKEVNKEYIKQCINSNYFFQYLETIATGTTIKNVSLKSMRGFPIIIPSTSLLNEIGRNLKSFSIRKKHNQKETETLTKLTDVLLPQLISGKLKVPEAMLEVEKVLGE